MDNRQIAKDIEGKIISWQKKDYSFRKEVVIPSANKQYRADLLMYMGGELEAIFEIKEKLTTESIDDTQVQLMQLALSINAPFAVMCDGEKAYLFDVYGYADKGYIPEWITLDEAMTLLTSLDEKEMPISKYHAEKVVDAFKQAFRKSGISNKVQGGYFQSLSVEAILANATESALHSIHFSAEFENAFFKALLKAYAVDEVCRYTTLDTLNRIFTDKKQSCCSIVCMNDKSECYYADHYVYEKESLPLSALSDESVRELNSHFITSCTNISHADNLSMWRMYADNARGVCLVLHTDKDMMKNGFLLAPVSYGREDGSHPELEIVKEIMNTSLKKYRVMFRTFNLWKHFFKSFDYADEAEIRLLYTDRDTSHYKWIKTGENIFAPVVEFDATKASNKYPLILKKVIFGPKSPDADTNVAQLRMMAGMSQLKFHEDKLKVEKSAIDNYR